MDETDLRAYILELEQALLEAVRHEQSLSDGLETRSQIGQAIGILMERENVGSTDAFEMLKSASQHQNLKLREIARRVVTEVEVIRGKSATPSVQ